MGKSVCILLIVLLAASVSVADPVNLQLRNFRRYDIAPWPRSVDGVVQPVFPEAALKDEVGATVTATLQINDAGQVTAVEAKSTRPYYGFEAAVEQAVLRWWFEPARHDHGPESHPVAAEITLTFRFFCEHSPQETEQFQDLSDRSWYANSPTHARDPKALYEPLPISCRSHIRN